ncbi:MAG: YoaK family protein [Methylovirgula sp.]
MSRHIALFLAFVAGFTDTITFVQAGLFSSHVTGNFVVFAAALGRGVGADDWLKLIAFPVSVFGVILATFAHDRLGCAPRLLLAVEAAVLLAIGAIGLVPLPFQTKAWLMMGLVVAMGWQNAGHRLYPPFGPLSGAMTNNIIQATIALWRHFLPAPASFPEVIGLALWRVIACFALGCALSVFVMHAVGLGAVVVPALLLAFLVARWEAQPHG